MKHYALLWLILLFLLADSKVLFLILFNRTAQQALINSENKQTNKQLLIYFILYFSEHFLYIFVQ